MKELVFKNITSGNKRRRDLFISETVEDHGVKTVTQRHSIYIIRNCTKFNDPKELMHWQKTSPINSNKRHIFIFKKRNTKAKEDNFICDVVGNFYAVVKDEVYSIAFKHSFEIDFLSTLSK